jgi:ATPase subunit of ABC transporter with duplicated ATPase domains
MMELPYAPGAIVGDLSVDLCYASGPSLSIGLASIILRDVGAAGKPLFQDLSFTLADGDRLGLVADNGAGKSTLLRCLAGLAEPSAGSITTSRGLRVAFVPQDVPADLLPPSPADAGSGAAWDLPLAEALRRALPPEEREERGWRVDVMLDRFAGQKGTLPFFAKEAAKKGSVPFFLLHRPARAAAGRAASAAGENGAGKSLLVRRLRQAVLDGGGAGVRVSPSVVMGYLDQQMAHLPAGETPHGFIGGLGRGGGLGAPPLELSPPRKRGSRAGDESGPLDPRFRGDDNPSVGRGRASLSDQRATSLLAGAGFAPERQRGPIGALSPGERARLGLLALRLTAPNLYLLDEPTSHLDIPGQEQLEAEILAHDASAILVTHDRRFARAVGTRFLAISRGRLIEVAADDPAWLVKTAVWSPLSREGTLLRGPASN